MRRLLALCLALAWGSALSAPPEGVARIVSDRLPIGQAQAALQLSPDWDRPHPEIRRALVIVHGRLRFDAAGRRLYCDELPVDLSSRELAVLELLLMRAGRVVTKQQIADHLYGWGDEVSSNAIEVFVHRLRRKLEPMGANIRTVRGMGYLIDKAHDD